MDKNRYTCESQPIGISIYNWMASEIILVEVSKTNQDCLQPYEIEKRRKYDILANELGLLHYLKT